MKRHIIIYSHGFGVRKDDRGLFTEIANSMPDLEHVMFDYNLIDEASNTLTVSSFEDQVQKLKSQLDKIDKDAVVDLVAHSQGCVVAALAKPQNIRKIMFIAPPDSVDVEQLIGFFGNRDGSTIDLNGQSKIPRRDGSVTIIPAAYWQSLRGLDVMYRYNQLSDLSQVKFFIASDDEVLGATNFDKIDERIELVQLNGNHDFTDDARQLLIYCIKSEILE